MPPGSQGPENVRRTCAGVCGREVVVVVVEAVAQRFAMNEPGGAACEREQRRGERPTSPGSAWQSFAAAGWTCPRRFADLGVAEQLLDRVLLDEAVTAEQVHRERRDAFGNFRREDLADNNPLRSGTAVARRGTAPRCRRSASQLQSPWPREQSGTGHLGSRRSPCRIACVPSYSGWHARAPRASPIIWAPMPIRPSLSVSMAALYPLPTSPRTCAFGTRLARRRRARGCCWLECRACLPSCRPKNPACRARPGTP